MVAGKGRQIDAWDGLLSGAGEPRGKALTELGIYAFNLHFLFEGDPKCVGEHVQTPK